MPLVGSRDRIRPRRPLTSELAPLANAPPEEGESALPRRLDLEEGLVDLDRVGDALLAVVPIESLRLSNLLNRLVRSTRAPVLAETLLMAPESARIPRRSAMRRPSDKNEIVVSVTIVIASTLTITQRKTGPLPGPPPTVAPSLQPPPQLGPWES